MAYEVVLNSFQGPLDLLLHLIEKDKLDINDIPISEITSQYMQYIQKWNSINLDVASEFIMMAATLVEIKSKMLLPNQEVFEEECITEESDPRQELVERLIEYKRFKNISQFFKELESNEGKVIYKDPEYFHEIAKIKQELKIDSNLLFKSFKRILLRQDMLKNQENYHHIQSEIFTIEEKIEEVLKKIENVKQIKFSLLFHQCESNNELITIFLALLELIKMNKVLIKQQELFEDFYIINPFKI